MILPSSPMSAFIQLTPYCNNRCPGCSNKFYDADTGRTKLPLPLAVNEWKEILLKLKTSVTRLRITGGEPTLYPAFEDFISFVSECQIPFALFTNARWRDPERLLKLLKENRSFRGMLISLHGATPEDHKAFSGVQGSFEETVGNIELALRSGLGVHTNTVITKENFDKIEQIYNFVRTLGVSQMVVARYIGKAVPEIELTEDQLKEAVHTVERMRKTGAQIKHSGCIPQCFVESGAYGCTAAYTFFTVDPWGNVSPCNHVSLICGNLMKQSVDQIWHSESMQHWRESVPTECENCFAYSTCHAGCHAAATAYGHIVDPLMKDPISTRLSSAKPPVNIYLSSTAKPLLQCRMRTEPFGFLLFRNTQSVPVSWEAKSVLDACNGTNTLERVFEDFGQQGLNLVGALTRRGLIKLMKS